MAISISSDAGKTKPIQTQFKPNFTNYFERRILFTWTEAQSPKRTPQCRLWCLVPCVFQETAVFYTKSKARNGNLHKIYIKNSCNLFKSPKKHSKREHFLRFFAFFNNNSQSKHLLFGRNQSISYILNRKKKTP